MKQTFHILTKDVRHLWIEILISLSAMVLVTYFEWQQRLPNHSSDFFVDVLPPMLLVLCWWLMVARLIQDEALVGDRQFWITRPYVWYNLVAAKAIFIALFVALPLGVSQIILLVLDGWPIHGHIVNIFWVVTATVIVAVLPSAAAATLTKTIPQWLIAMVGLIFFVVGMIVLDEYIPNSHVATGKDNSEALQLILFTAFLLSGLTVLYFRRKRAIAAILFVLALLTSPAVMIATPYKKLINNAFPSSNENVVVLNLKSSKPLEGPPRILSEKKLSLVFPMEVSGIAEDSEVRLSGARLVLDSSAGRRWESNWETNWMTMDDTTKETKTSFTIKKEDYEALKNQPVVAHLEFAVTELHEINPERVILQPAFENHLLGRCRISEDGREVQCHSAFIETQETTLSLRRAESTCSSEKPQGERPVMSQRAFTVRSSPFSPLTTTTFSSFRYSDESKNTLFCAGTPVTFTIPEVRRRYRMQLDLGQIQIKDYAREYGMFLF